MAGKLVKERRAEHKRYKDDVAREGKPFFPYAIFHDTIMAFVTVAVIIALACIWYVSAGDTEEGKGLEAGVLGPWYTPEADAGTTSFVPRPDWFFYFLFYLLRVFKWPDSVILGSIGLPTVFLIMLLALPFYDRRPERRMMRRPVAMVAAILVVISMGVLTWKGATAKESLPAENLELVPEWSAAQGFTGNADAVRGAEIFAQTGCMNCHTFLGAGTAYPGAPDLTEIGATGRPASYYQDYIANPSKYGKSMPAFPDLGAENLALLGAFLEASKGEK
jgi:menaquinol-cytochrome c reductase cytochrome b/c subunit